MIERIRNYAIDSYNGLYKIVLKPYMPRRNTVIALLVGFLIGLIWAYVVSTTVFYDADPSQLGQSWQDEWVKLLADRYANSNFDVSANIQELLGRVDDPVGILNRLLSDTGLSNDERARFEAIMPFAQNVQATAAAAPDTGNFIGSFFVPWILAPILVVVLFVVVTLLWGLLIYPNFVGPAIGFIKRGGKPDEGKLVIESMKAQKLATEKAKAEAVDRLKADTRGAPVFQRVSIYNPGRSYDESFAIETADDVFLGECGASISESADGKAAAIEVWIFDKEDFTKTLTQVFVAPAGFVDPAMRAKLETRGDLIEAKPGALANFETQTLLMEVRISDIAYATGGGLAPNSAFEKITFDFAVWTKSGQVAGKVAGAVMGQATFAPPPVTPLPTPPASPSFAPPPSPSPTYAPPPSPAPTYAPPPPLSGSPGLTPLKPPPLTQPPPRPEDDDMFGGTGDFTPVN